ncbi:MAG: hypothetical protein V5A27_02485 [Halapricum sp.]
MGGRGSSGPDGETHGPPGTVDIRRGASQSRAIVGRPRGGSGEPMG